MRRVSLALAIALLSAGLMAETLELTGGDVMATLNSATGSVGVYQLSERGKNRYESLLEDKNKGTTSWFAVSFNGTVYKLSRRLGKPIKLEPTDRGARYVFELTDDCLVTQNVSLLSDRLSGSPGAVVIETIVENTSGKRSRVSLKALFDTVLGEGEGIHFSTDRRNRISSETLLMTGRDPDRILISRGKARALAIYIDSDAATKPESVHLANWERLSTLSWTPEVIEGRSFNTIYSIQDSAALFTWPELTIEPNASYVVRVIAGPYREGADLGTQSFAVSRQLPDSGLIEAQAVSATLTESERQRRIRVLLDKISVVEQNPDRASDSELASLNRQLDVLLSASTVPDGASSSGVKDGE